VAAIAFAVAHLRRVDGAVRVHLRPTPHLHVVEAGVDGAPALELRVPARREPVTTHKAA
jgi:hypothetical protein